MCAVVQIGLRLLNFGTSGLLDVYARAAICYLHRYRSLEVGNNFTCHTCWLPCAGGPVVCLSSMLVCTRTLDRVRMSTVFALYKVCTGQPATRLLNSL